MSTFQQILRKKKKLSKSDKVKYNRSPKLKGCPQKRAVVVKIYTSAVPKKPNSANRKIIKARLSTGAYIRAAVGGIGFVFQEHSTVLIRPNRVRDIPGIHYRAIRGTRDFLPLEKFSRRKGRSKYAIRVDKNPVKFITKYAFERVKHKLKSKQLEELAPIVRDNPEYQPTVKMLSRIKKQIEESGKTDADSLAVLSAGESVIESRVKYEAEESVKNEFLQKALSDMTPSMKYLYDERVKYDEYRKQKGPFYE